MLEHTKYNLSRKFSLIRVGGVGTDGHPVAGKD